MQHEYMQVAEALGLPEMNRTKISLKSRSVDSPESVLSLLQRCLAFSGWICYQSGIVTLPIAKLPDDLGYPLSAEIAGKHTSFRLLPDGHGGWSVLSVDESPDGKLDVLYDCVEQIGNQHAPGILQYRRFWKRDENNGYSAFAARFTGFAEGGV